MSWPSVVEPRRIFINYGELLIRLFSDSWQWRRIRRLCKGGYHLGWKKYRRLFRRKWYFRKRCREWNRKWSRERLLDLRRFSPRYYWIWRVCRLFYSSACRSKGLRPFFSFISWSRYLKNVPSGSGRIKTERIFKPGLVKSAYQDSSPDVGRIKRLYGNSRMIIEFIFEQS